MGLYLYVVGAADHPDPQAVEGIEGAPVRALDIAGFRTWVATLAAAPGASLERVRAHNAVVEASSDLRTPLPMRFGQWYADEGELRDALYSRRATLESSLERVRGALEFGVRVMDPERRDPVRPDRSSGRAYLEGLARREETLQRARLRGAEVAAELLSFLGPLVRAHSVRPGGTDGLVAIAHLVGRHDTRTYQDRVHTFTDRRPELRFVTSGPWPPYGFVQDGS
jgi:hypothetical protein